MDTEPYYQLGILFKQPCTQKENFAQIYQLAKILTDSLTSQFKRLFAINNPMKN